MKKIFQTILFLAALAGPITTNGDGITTISKTNKLLKQGELAFKKGDFKTAIQAYESALKESSEVPAQANMNLGSAYFQTKDFPKAQKNYQTAASSLNSPGLKSVAYQQIGNIFSEQKDYKSALDWYKKSLKTNPANESARFNYELAYKLNKKKEEEEKKENPEKDKKQNPENKQDQKDQKDQKQDQKKEDKGKEGKDKDGKDKDQKGKEDEKNGQKPGEQQKGKGPDSKDGKDPKKGDDANAPETDKESAVGKEKNQEEKDKDGKEESKNKKDESNVDDPNAIRVDKKKLQETGLSEEQAKSLLEAMKQSEVKYLQQRRFKSPKGGADKSKQRW